MHAERTAPKYPEHDKLSQVSELSNAIGEFLDFGLPQQGIYLAEVNTEGWSNDRLVPCGKTIQAILATYFEIDEAKLEQEKRAMLEAIRNA